MKPFHESLRYEYPLDPTSLVVDVGAYHGDWSKEMARKYGCRVIAFEPIRAHFIELVCNINLYPTICAFNAALGSGSIREMGVSNNSSGWFSPSQVKEEVSIARVCPFLVCAGRIDVLKMNAEGSEYELLEIIVNSGLHLNIKNIQVQFHDCVPDWMAKYESITERLSKTHVQEWDSAFVWENWRLR